MAGTEIPKEIIDKTMYFRSLESLHQIYGTLKAKFPKPSKPQAPKVTLKTKAGDFYLSGEEARKAFKTLEDWDTEDGQQDGNISEHVRFKYVSSQSALPSVKYGLALKFDRFVPKKIWKTNFGMLDAAMKAGRIYTDFSGAVPVKNEEELWLLATSATLGGLTPDLIQSANTLCNASNNCEWFFQMREGTKYTGRFTEGSQRIYWSLADPTNPQDLKYGFLHERGHTIFNLAAIAKSPSIQRFWNLLVVWAIKQPNHKDVVLRIQSVHDEYLSRNNEGTQEAIFNLLYLTEELADLPFVEIANPELKAEIKKNVLPIVAGSAKLSPEDLETRLNGRSKDRLIAVLYEAMFIHRSSAFDKETADALQKNVEAFLQSKGDQKTLKIFRDFLLLGKAVREFVDTKDFKDFVSEKLPDVYKPRRKK